MKNKDEWLCGRLWKSGRGLTETEVETYKIVGALEGRLRVGEEMDVMKREERSDNFQGILARIRGVWIGF